MERRLEDSPALAAHGFKEGANLESSLGKEGHRGELLMMSLGITSMFEIGTEKASSARAWFRLMVARKLLRFNAGI